MYITCVDCGADVIRKSPRGRKPLRCEACKKAKHNKECRDRNRTNYVPQNKGRVFSVVCVCKNCNTSFQAKAKHAAYCSRECRNAARSSQSGRHPVACKHCGKHFLCSRKKQKHCSAQCRALGSRKRIVATCANQRCGKEFETRPGRLANGHRFCCRECSYHEPLVCQNPACGKQFRMKHRTKDGWKNKGKYCCPECYRDHRWGTHRPRISRSKTVRSAASRAALATSLRKRCKVFGVTFDPACTRQAVLDRDGRVCQKCHVVCNKEYVLDPVTFTPDVRNAEHDHIWPLSVPGSPGNVFQNSQCLCRKCNMAKGDTVEGQLRLCLEEEAWGKGVRVRSQLNLRLCEATQVAGQSTKRSRSRQPMAL